MIYVESPEEFDYLISPPLPSLEGTVRCRPTIPLDAPIQPRRYLTPSATSRKDVPTYFARQLHQRAASTTAPSITTTTTTSNNGYGCGSGEDEQDELTEEAQTLDLEVEQQILDKRRRNTLSARKSRQRRIKQMEDLERERNELQKLVYAYHTRVMQLRMLLKNHGIMEENHLPGLMRVPLQ
ncbi:hypothetical protein AX17_002242 [Amanita inopinata Kibby_2008]|nr:hypothetical protein AX17_002242 [Amanita inopinata Kibby_2008]